MQAFWTWWTTLDPQAQAALIGAAASVVFGVVRHYWPALNLTQARVKQYLVALLAGVGALLAGVGAYATTGNLLSALLAILSALGSYAAWKHQVAGRVKPNKAPAS